mmetsp:Transcript_21134/g.47613  ORF Transcript_21134/g.47613 Transcript_21134/m.47613 type:complete len:131 (-) Transcript_21134:435-827(-)
MEPLTHIRLLLTRTTPFRVVNVGGGPGFDAVGLQLLADFVGADVHFHHEVLDIELGWVGVVECIGSILSDACQGARTSLSFHQCDMIDTIPLCGNPDVRVVCCSAVVSAVSVRRWTCSSLRTSASRMRKP